MIRILWEIPNVNTWTGGVNYFCNLGRALASLPKKVMEPVLSGSVENHPAPLCNMQSIPIYSRPPASIRSLRNIRCSLEQVIYGEDKDYDRYLHRHKINILSHLIFPSGKTDIPLLAWIPDFQHRYLTQHFSKKEIDNRDCHQAEQAKCAQGILLSSEDARRDFNRFYPGYEGKTHVLHFVAIPPSLPELPPLEQVLDKYGIAEPYFHVPNQVWAHKNHGVILDSLCLLRKRGRCPLVISTGQSDDYRNPEYFNQLSKRVQDSGMGEYYRFLGLIDYQDACTLMRGAVALINPSLFEGWSTTVEEAKSLGKRMILSSLSVHREQAPERSAFFDPQNPEQLARLMEETLSTYDPALESVAMQEAGKALPGRIQKFGLEYVKIIHNILKR